MTQKFSGLSSTTPDWQVKVKTAVASLFTIPSKVNVTILSFAVSSAMESFAEAEAAPYSLRRELAASSLSISYAVTLPGDLVDTTDPSGGAALIKAQSTITNAIGTGSMTAALALPGVSASTAATYINLPTIWLRSAAPTPQPSVPSPAPTSTLDNPTSGRYELATGNNKWIALSLAAFLIIFVFLFSVVCYKMQSRKAQAKLEERGTLFELQEIRVRKAPRQSKNHDATKHGKGGKEEEDEEKDLERWTSHSTQHDNPMSNAKGGKHHHRDHEKEEKAQEEPVHVHRPDDKYATRMALLGIKAPARLSLQGSTVTSRVEGEWVEKYSKSKQATYYKNSVTGVVAWQVPAGAEVARVSKKSSSSRGASAERESDKHAERKAAHTSRKEGHEDRINPAFAHDRGDYHKPDRHAAARGHSPDSSPRRLDPTKKDNHHHHHRHHHSPAVIPHVFSQTGEAAINSDEPPEDPEPPAPSSSRSPQSALSNSSKKDRDKKKHRTVQIQLDEPSEPPPDNDVEVWVEKMHAEKGRAYYKSQRTHAISWLRPEGPDVQIVSYQVFKAATLKDGGKKKK